MPRIEKIQFVGTFRGRDDAAAALKNPGDTALVQRGVPRMLLMNCPCGCGDLLVINLDSRAGPAWKTYRRGPSITLYPSYWRDANCGAHFILWRDQIYWCDWDNESIWTSSNSIEDRVLLALPSHFISYQNLAEHLGEVPWDVLQACHALVRRGRAVMNSPHGKGEFRAIATHSSLP